MRRLLPFLLFPALALGAVPPAVRTLPNGLTVMVVEDHSLPLVTVEVGVRAGSMVETPEYNGLSHLYEHMFFKANAVIPNQEAYMARLRELGIEFNGTTGEERVNYFFTTTSDHFDPALVFMRDALLTPKFEQKELERERVVVTGEIDRAEASPFFAFGKEMREAVWWKYPSRRNPLGERSTVLKATPQQMKTLEERWFVPNNSTLVLSGDVKADHAFEQVEKLFGAWKRTPDPFQRWPVPKPPPIAKSRVIAMEHPEMRTVSVMFEWQGPSTVGDGVELTYGADLLAFAISEASSKFQKALVDSGACVGAGFGWQTAANVGPITFNAEATPEKVDDCVRAMLAELPKMKAQDYLSPEEMKNAAFREEVEEINQRETPSEYAHVLTFWWASAGLDYYQHYTENLRKVQPPDVARFLEGYVYGKPYVFGALLPQGSKEHGLDAAHFEALLGLAQKKGGAK